MAQIKKLSDGKYLIRASRGSGSGRVFDNVTFEGTLAEAREEARDMEILLSRGRLAGVRFEKCFELWIKAVTPRLAPRTIDGYDGSIRRYALAPLGKIKLGKIERHDIQAVYAACGHLSPTTVRNLHASLNAMFSWLVRRGDIKQNPCRHTERPARSKPEIVTLSPAEALRFVDVCREMPLGIVFEFALETGMRPEEYLALRWRDIAGGEVSVVQAVQFNRTKGGGYYFKDLKTKQSRRRIPITEELRLQLVRHRREQNEQRLAMKGTWFNHDLVFPNIVGRPIEMTNLTRRYFAPILAKCGLGRHLRIYDLRHTCATLLLMAGVNVKVVSERLGHASVVQTLDTYSHVLPHMQDAATDAIGRILRRA